jgi:two-component system, OmpR family, sensor kinase
VRFGRSRQLRHQLFIWLGLTILATAVTVAVVFRVGHGDTAPFGVRAEAAKGILAEQFGRVWYEPTERGRLAAGLQQALGLSVTLLDTDGNVIEQVGRTCRVAEQSVAVRRGAEPVGQVQLCFAHARSHFAGTGLMALVAALVVLWGAAAFLARRITRPLSQLIAVTREMGMGNLGARVRLGRYGKGELKVLADSVNDMGRRIERQLRDQRELLAVVSHEVRSPLARIRVCSELLRSSPTSSETLAALDQEVEDLDTLLGKLLAHSRLDFGTLAKSEVTAFALAETAFTRRRLAVANIRDLTDGARVNVDVTLLGRALDNLLDNAERYARSAARCTLRWASEAESPDAPAVVFEVTDEGPGFEPQALPRVFEAFYQSGEIKGARAAGLGLGLSLVERIAQAHGGRAWASNLPAGGAQVAFSVQAASPPSVHGATPSRAKQKKAP